MRRDILLPIMYVVVNLIKVSLRTKLVKLNSLFEIAFERFKIAIGGFGGIFSPPLLSSGTK